MIVMMMAMTPSLKALKRSGRMGITRPRRRAARISRRG
jgi:hypothetical protein